MTATRDEILASGLRIVNARGLASLSIRGVAEDLGLSPGNVSYHFPRKEDLVTGLVHLLRAGNQRRLARELGSLGDFLEMFRELFENQHEFRGLVLALPDVLETFDQLRTEYRRVEHHRRRALFERLAGLRARGVVAGSDTELSRLVSHLTLIARFWIAEARVTYSKYGRDRAIAHYLALIADNLEPLATPVHAAEIEPYRAGWIDLDAT